MDSLHRTVQQLRSELGRYKHRVHKAEQQVAKVGIVRKVMDKGGEKVERRRENYVACILVSPVDSRREGR